MFWSFTTDSDSLVLWILTECNDHHSSKICGQHKMLLTVSIKNSAELTINRKAKEASEKSNLLFNFPFIFPLFGFSDFAIIDCNWLACK